MKKEILVQFAGQSKAVVEKVEIKYYGEVEEFDNSEKYINDNILKECIELQEQAARHAANQTFKKNR